MYAKSTTTISNILHAAQHMFLTKNYADVSMTSIAAAADVTKGALYHHFTSKEELYEAMLLADLAEKGHLMQVAVAYQGTCRERLHKLTLTFLNLPPQNRQLIQLVRRDINIFTDPMRERLIQAYQFALPEQVEAIIRIGVADGELIEVDPRLLSWQFVAMVEVALSDYTYRVLGQDNCKMADYMLNLFFNGAGKR